MLSTLGGIIVVVGFIGSLVTGIMLLIANFKKSIAWGVCSLIFGLPLIIYCFMNFAEVKKPFLMYIGFVVLMVIGGILGILGAPAPTPELPSP
jgi:uncharacterized membrane protein YphA (DoxX/SURF4 family)